MTHTRGPFVISVVIPHLNQPEMLARCLRSLAAGTRIPDEIIVVDNGSAEMPQAICAAYPGVRLLHEATPGPGPARNCGVAASLGAVIAFIDADCIADPGWLAAAETEMADPAATILGGDVRIALDRPGHYSALEAYESIYAYRMDRYIAREGFTGTGNLVVRRAVIDAVGPYAGLSVAEDKDWGQRATAAGYAIRYVPQMKVFHPARRTYAELRAKWGRHIAHEFVAGTNGAAARLKWAAKTGALLVSPLAELPRILTTDRVEGAGARFRAFLALSRIRAYRAATMARLFVVRDPAALSSAWNRPSETETDSD